MLEFLNPISNDLVHYSEKLSKQSLGQKIIKHTEIEFPLLNKINLAIIGVTDNRGNEEYEEQSLENFRKSFYNLFPGNWKIEIADLGDLKIGHETNDTYFALKSICEELIKNKIIPIIIGGSQDLTYAIYRSYDKLEQMVNIATIDSKFDFYKEEKKDADAYLSKIIIEEPNNLFNYSTIGFQTYYNSQEEIDLIEKLYFDAYRLGEIINNIKIVEPILRDADIISIDFTSIKSCESGYSKEFIPNGFDSREICSLARYSGISDKTTSFGLFNHNNTKKEVQLIAQIIWYFIEGVNFRSYEYPFEDKSEYLKYIVPIDNEELIFYKSNRSERWWIEIEIKAHNNYNKKTLFPCTKEDYLAANEQNIPERWWKAIRKNTI